MKNRPFMLDAANRIVAANIRWQRQTEPYDWTRTQKTFQITPVPLKSPINIDDYRHLVMWKGVEVEQVPVKWAFSRRA